MKHNYIIKLKKNNQFLLYTKGQIISSYNTTSNAYIKLYNKTTKLNNAHITVDAWLPETPDPALYKLYINYSGNIASLINYAETIEENQFEGLLSGNFISLDGCFSVQEVGHRIDINVEFPFKTLSKNCFKNMFKNCKYNNTLYGKTAFALNPSTFINIETLAEGCFESMFENSYIYSKIGNGTELYLLARLILPSANLVTNCYKNMFKNCPNVYLIILPTQALASGSCYEMFERCSNLTTLSTHFTDWKDDQNATTNWLSETCISGNGTFYKESGLSTIIDNSHIPSNWTPKDYN